MSKRSRSTSAAASSVPAAAAASSSSSSAAAHATSAGPSKRPRHIHAGPDLRLHQAQDDDEEKQISAPTSSPIRRLHRHALESILGFFTSVGLSRALQVCKEWNAAVRTMKSIGFFFDLNSSTAHLHSLLHSPLARHLGELHGHFGDEGELPWAISPAIMSQLAQRATELRSLICTCMLPPTPAVLVFPHKLQKAELTLATVNSAEQLHGLFTSLNALPSLESIELCFDSEKPSSLNFQLLHPTALRSFTLTDTDPEPLIFTDAHLDSFRTPFFANLDCLSIPGLAANRFVQLLRTPHALRWKKLTRLPRGLSAEAGSKALMSLAGTLTTVSLWPPHGIGVLPQLRRLTDLELHLRFRRSSEPWPVTAEAILAALMNCPLLTRLHLQAPLTSKHMATLLPRLPLLTDLTLDDMTELESLSFFPLCLAAHRSLTSLCVRLSRRSDVHFRELYHVFCLRSLRKLELHGAFAAWIGPFAFGLLTPPSVVFPQLEHFSEFCRPP